MRPHSIRSATPSDYESWRSLWDGYLTFYETALDQDVTVATWKKILDPDWPVECLLARNEKEQIVGFLHYILQESTSNIEPVCYLEDLFVHPNSRRKGIGESLIRTLIQVAKNEKWGQIYWHTKEDNLLARALYDKFTRRDSFVRYVLKTGD